MLHMWYNYNSERDFTNKRARAERTVKMEEVGMTDLQFKSFLMLLIKQLEEAKTEEEKEAIIQELKKMLQG